MMAAVMATKTSTMAYSAHYAAAIDTQQPPENDSIYSFAQKFPACGLHLQYKDANARPTHGIHDDAERKKTAASVWPRWRRKQI